MSNSPLTTQKSTRNNLIQIFRAFAIIAVVMIHTTPPGEWQVICRPFINFSVATFLFLSGYLTKAENDNWGSFYRKRIIRVIIPYIIWTVLYSLPAILNEGIERLFVNLITAKACVTLYYIFVYIQFVLLTPVLCKLAKSKYQYVGWIIAPISVLIFKYYGLITGTELNRYIAIMWSDSCLGWFTFYYLGLLLGNRIININYSLKGLSIVYIISLLLQMAEGYVWLLFGEANCGTQTKLTAILSSCIFLLIIHNLLKNKNISIKSEFLTKIGDYSFGIYLCHILLMIFLYKIPYYKLIPYPLNSAIIILISLGGCILGYKILGAKIAGWLGLR